MKPNNDAESKDLILYKENKTDIISWVDNVEK